jgi:phage FluMu protein Com
MNIRCAFCQTPYTLSRVEMLDALQEMDSKKLTHYDAHCPRCRRATQIPRQRLEMAMPNWRDELKEFEAEMKEHPQQAAPAPESTTEPASVAEKESSPAPALVNPKPKADTKAKPATGKDTGTKPAARSEPGDKAPAKNTPAASSQKGKKTTKRTR